MTIDEIYEMWEKDCAIDNNFLSDASVDTPKIHSKYVQLLVNTKLKLTKLNYDYNTLRKTKFRYYRGELTRDELKELGWEQWAYSKPLKADMEEFLTGDDDLAKLKIKIEYLEAMQFLLESIMKAISARDWQIRNSIEFKKFIAGN